MALSKEQQDALNKDLPASAVKSRKSGRDSLSYVDGFYVFDTLNRIIGPGSWGYEIRRLDCVQNVSESKDGRDRSRVAYICTVTLRLDGAQEVTDVGYGNGINPDEGAAHESASKEAVTDAVKRCARSLGRSLGLALYDKDRTHVSHEPDLEAIGELRESVRRGVVDLEGESPEAKRAQMGKWVRAGHPLGVTQETIVGWAREAKEKAA